MFIESLCRLLHSYSYLLLLLSIALLGFSAGVICAPFKCKRVVECAAAGHNHDNDKVDDRSPGFTEHDQRIAQRTDQSEAEEGSGEGVNYITGCKHLGRRGVLMREEQHIMNTSKGKVEEKREMQECMMRNRSRKGLKVEMEMEMEEQQEQEMEEREEQEEMQECMTRNRRKGKVAMEEEQEQEEGRVQNMKQESGYAGLQKTKEGKELQERDSKNPRPVWGRSLSEGPRRAQDSNPGRQQPLLVQVEDEDGGVQRENSLTGEEVKELADAFIARVRQRMRVQRQESYEKRQRQDLARQASYEARPSTAPPPPSQ